MKPFAVQIPDTIDKDFRALAAAYGHRKQLGVIVSAALLAFGRCTDEERGDLIEQVNRIIREERMVSGQAAAEPGHPGHVDLAKRAAKAALAAERRLDNQRRRSKGA